MIAGTAATDCEIESCWRTRSPRKAWVRTCSAIAAVFLVSQSRVSTLHRMSGRPSPRTVELHAP